MLAVLLPVKEFSRSKQRLSGWLTPAERQALARVMFEDVWAALRSSALRDHLLVITSEPYVMARCRREAVPCRIESAPRSHSESVREATRWAIRRGATALLSVPIDTPAVAAAEITELAELASRYAVVVVPSADGSGTNALLRTPPDCIQPRFGPGSCALHVAQAQAQGLPHRVHAVESLGADIDTPEEAARFLSLDRPCRTTALLRSWLEARPELLPGVAACS